MARSCESCDPSSSDNVREELSLWERTKDGVKKVVVKCMAGVAIVGTALGVTGCGRGDRIAVPESPSVSASESPSTSPSATEKTVDPKDLADERYDQVREEFKDITPERFANLPLEKRLKPYREALAQAKAWGSTESPNNDLYNPSGAAVKPGKYCTEPASETDSAEEVAAKILGPVVTGFDTGPWDPDFARMVTSAAFYGNPELRKSALDDMLRNGKISTSEYAARKTIVALLEAKDKKEKSGYQSNVPGSKMFKVLKVRFAKAKPYVDPKTGETLPTQGLQLVYESTITDGVTTGSLFRVVKNGDLWQIVDDEVTGYSGVDS
jgi:hypothetical protein